MNIDQAKEEIKHTLQAYLRRDEDGMYVYPAVNQRPILLMGPPGVGKTAIMQQIARECGVGLVAYTMTHHTRQSAIGLPRITAEEFKGERYDVTRYTMSEIITSIYDCIRTTGVNEGILFIDEINCVSETLTPVILQLLQNKQFGTHKVPEGWMIVAAGNPPQYNRSARDFDIVTLDRVRRIDVEAELDSWMDYALSNGIHGAIIAYLKVHPERFYLAEEEDGNLKFVTARGWEDLSKLILSYEQMELEITRELIAEFLEDRRTAEDFAAFYHIYEKNGMDYDVPSILDGTMEEEERSERVRMAEEGSFEERLTVTQLLLSSLTERFRVYEKTQTRLSALSQAISRLHLYMKDSETIDDFGFFLTDEEMALEVRRQKKMIEPEEERLKLYEIRALKEISEEIRESHVRLAVTGLKTADAYLQRKEDEEEMYRVKTDEMITRAFAFAGEAFGKEQEMLLLVSGLARDVLGRKFLTVSPNEAFLEYARVFSE